jgi:hypothetical protein
MSTAGVAIVSCETWRVRASVWYVDIADVFPLTYPFFPEMMLGKIIFAARISFIIFIKFTEFNVC